MRQLIAPLSRKRVGEFQVATGGGNWVAIRVRSQPVHIASKYVFWLTSANDKPVPMFGFESLVIDTYGFSWHELIEVYENLIWIDEFLDAEDFASRMG